MPLADDGQPLGPPALAGAWPFAVRDATGEDWSRRPSMPAARFGAILGVLDRWAVIVGGDSSGIAVRITWSEEFPYLWFWEEQGRTDAEPMASRVRCLGLEPASVPTGEGLARAIETGDAYWINPGKQVSSWVELEVVD